MGTLCKDLRLKCRKIAELVCLPVGSETHWWIRKGETANIGADRIVNSWKVFHRPSLSDTAAHPILDKTPKISVVQL
jgi:hypothetical protein